TGCAAPPSQLGFLVIGLLVGFASFHPLFNPSAGSAKHTVSPGLWPGPIFICFRDAPAGAGSATGSRRLGREAEAGHRRQRHWRPRGNPTANLRLEGRCPLRLSGETGSPRADVEHGTSFLGVAPRLLRPSHCSRVVIFAR